MLERRFVYSIEGLSPRTDEKGDFKLGGYGFSIYLDREFAKMAHQKELPEGHHLNEIAESILIDCQLIKKGERYHNPPYKFVENEEGNLTSLVRYFQVPGNACELNVSWNELERLKREKPTRNWIEYHPHNVDSHRQAYALLSLFTTWVDIMNSVLGKEIIQE